VVLVVEEVIIMEMEVQEQQVKDLMVETVAIIGWSGSLGCWWREVHLMVLDLIQLIPIRQ
jgi:hypothetical protein